MAEALLTKRRMTFYVHYVFTARAINNTYSAFLTFFCCLSQKAISKSKQSDSKSNTTLTLLSWLNKKKLKEEVAL